MLTGPPDDVARRACELSGGLKGKGAPRGKAASEKRMLCLIQVIAAEFRGALSAILGVRVAISDNEQVRVTSRYDLEAAFVFQPVPRDATGDDGGHAGGAWMQLVAQGEWGPQELWQLTRNLADIE